MQSRSSLNVWLLFAATAAVDLVVLNWTRLYGKSDNQELIVAALVFGELSVACIWTLHSVLAKSLRLAFFAVACLAATAGFYFGIHGGTRIDAATVITLQTIGLFLAIWLQKTIVARRHREMSAGRYSIMDLFVLMTVTAVAAMLIRSTDAFRSQWGFPTLLLVSNSLGAAVAVHLRSQSWHWALRLAATLTMAIAFGWLLEHARPYLAGKLEIMYCLQLLIIFAWMEFGGILPQHHHASGGAGMEPTSR